MCGDGDGDGNGPTRQNQAISVNINEARGYLGRLQLRRLPPRLPFLDKSPHPLGHILSRL